MPELPNDFAAGTETSPPAGSSLSQGPDLPRRRPLDRLAALWRLVFRLGILGAGVSLGWWVGAIAAQLLPGSAPSDPPVSEIGLRRVSRVGRKVRQLPQWWSADLASPGLPQEANPAPPPAAAEPAAPAPSAALEPAQQEAIAADLSALETELDALDNRLADLEVSLGQPVSDAPLEARLQRLSRTVAAAEPPAEPPAAAPTPAPTPSPAAPASPAPATVSGTDPLFQLARDRVTLPSALLFAPGQAILTPSAERILDTILADLSRYPGATILVGSHSAGPEPPEQQRDLTFRQALAVQQYLAAQLNQENRWLPVGYGQSRPLVVGNTPAEQQRNQRIEIAIVPNQ